MDKLYVHMWEEDVVIPAYETGAPEKNPMFFEKRVYQGSSGAVYPYPIIEKIYDEKKDQVFHAVFLENTYIKIMVLPQLGGRIHMAFDKIANRHFIYYNEVIKPALVGLCGPWISGGIEFNWPQHHRPSTFSPIDFMLQENEDGSKTIWVNEIEKMNGTKGMAGFTLYPGKAYIEVKARLFNRSALPNTFLWWANPAVAVNEHYQSVFPPDVHAVYDHGRRDVSDFPIATGTYYKVDYSPGTDISKYKNIPVPTSYMAVNSAYDFIGGYEHDTGGGMLHIANHHIAPGKKQWTWGNGDFGRAWDRNLTDTNGPYVELMTGVYTDNQPDFSWLMPYERKSFEQYFMPYRRLALVKAATKDLALAFSVKDQAIDLRLFASSLQEVDIQVWHKNDQLFRTATTISPEQLYETVIPVPEETKEPDLLLVITNPLQEEVLRYQPETAQTPVPLPARAPLLPAQMKDNETLYLTGLHLEQYRHATFDPTAYYEEALKRDAGDIRNNNAMGLWLLRRGKAARAEAYFRKAVETLTQYNGNPYDGEPYYNLGCSLQQQEKWEPAYNAFYKAVWNHAWQSNAFFALAQIDIRRGQFATALSHLEQSLNGNAGNNKAIALRALALRCLGQPATALQAVDEGLRKDPFNLALYFEKYQSATLLLQHDAAAKALQQLIFLSRGDAHSFIEYANDYAHAGRHTDALQWLSYALNGESGAADPMLYYYLGWNVTQMGNLQTAAEWFCKAAAAPHGTYFPNRTEDITVLNSAVSANPADSAAHYLLGCIWFDKKQYNDAIQHWQQAVHINDQLPAAWRNLGIAFFNKKKDSEAALRYFEKAWLLNTSDARILMELDQLYKRTGKHPEERLALLEQYPEQVLLRDDLYLEKIAVLNYLGQHQQACDLLMERQFHPWEGGEGKVAAQYKLCLVQLAKQCIELHNYSRAIELLCAAQVYPHNLGEGKLHGTPENDIFYLLGTAHEALHEMEEAVRYYRKATIGAAEPTAAIFYNDPQPDAIFYQGLAWEKLQEPAVAAHIFERLVVYGKVHRHDSININFFAVSLPDLLVFDDNLDKRNTVHCTYMIALGYLGQRNYGKAAALLQEVMEADAMHQGAKLHLQWVPELLQK